MKTGDQQDQNYNFLWLPIRNLAEYIIITLIVNIMMVAKKILTYEITYLLIYSLIFSLTVTQFRDIHALWWRLKRVEKTR